MINLSAFSDALQKVLLPAIETQIYSRAPGFQLFGGWNAEEKVATRAGVNVTRFDNNQFFVPIMTSYHSGVVSIAEGETLVSGQPQLDQGTVNITTNTGDFEITKQLLNVKDKGAIAKAITFYANSLADHMAMDLNRQVYGSGNAVIDVTASSTGTAGSTALTLAASINGDIDFARYLPPGVNIQIGSTTPVTVTAVTGTNAVTISAARVWNAGDNVVKLTGSLTPASELAGLGAMLSTTSTYMGIAPSADAQWKAAAVTNLGRDMVLTDLDQAFMAANRVGNVDWIIMNASLFRSYGALLQGQIRFAPTDVLFGGWKGLEYMGGNAKVLLDYDCPDDRVHFLSSKNLIFGQYQPLEFEKGTDGILLREVSKLNYEVVASWMGNIATNKRAAHALLYNVTALSRNGY